MTRPRTSRLFAALALASSLLPMALTWLLYWEHDPAMYLFGIGLSFLVALVLYVGVLRRRSPARPEANPILRGFRGLLVCLNVAVLLAGAAFTRPAPETGFCYRLGNVEEYEVKALLHHGVLPFLAGYPWVIVLASVIASVGVYVFARQYLVKRDGRPGH